MQFLMGYFLGLAVALVTIAVGHEPLSASAISNAASVCADNKGLKEINRGEISCTNGATFQLGGGK